MKHATVLDVGSSKIVSLCAGRVAKDGLAVHGADVRAYEGYCAGQFVNVDDLQRAVVESLSATQRECGFRLREISISVPAPFTKVFIGKGTQEFSSPPKRITGEDIDMLINASLPKEVPEGYRLIHSTPFSYVLDGAFRSDIGEDAYASRIEVNVSHMYVSEEAFLTPVREAIQLAGYQPGVCISSALAQALMLISEKERQEPAVLIDVGYAHTDVVIALRSAIVGQDTIEMGGKQFAGDLAYGLNITKSVAELVKRRYVFSLDYQDSVELIRTAEGTLSVERSQIQYILEERAKELCFMVDDSIHELGVDIRNRPAAYLSGGGLAMMRGSREYLEGMLGIKVKRDMPWMPRMNSANYMSAYGTLEFVLHTDAETVLTPPDHSGMFRRIKDLFAK